MKTWLMVHMNNEAKEQYSLVRRVLRKIYWHLRYPIDSFTAPSVSTVMLEASRELPMHNWKTVAFTLKDYLNTAVENPLVRGSITKNLDDHIQKMLNGYRDDTDFLVSNGCIDLKYADKNLCHNLQNWRRCWMIHMSKQLANDEISSAFYVYGSYPRV